MVAVYLLPLFAIASGFRVISKAHPVTGCCYQVWLKITHLGANWSANVQDVTLKVPCVLHRHAATLLHGDAQIVQQPALECMLHSVKLGGVFPLICSLEPCRPCKCQVLVVL